MSNNFNFLESYDQLEEFLNIESNRKNFLKQTCYNSIKESTNKPPKNFANTKIKDAYGELIVCYHGSVHEHSIRDIKAPVIWVSDDIDFAMSYGNSIKKVVVNMSNPLDIRDHSESIYDLSENGDDLILTDEFKYLVKVLKLNEKMVLAKLHRYFEKHRDDFEDFEDMACWVFWFIPEFVEQVKKLGYDGLLGTELGTTVYAVFNPKQLYEIN